MVQSLNFQTNSDLDSADFQSSKFIAKLSTDVATSALLDKIVLEVNFRGRSFEVNQSAIDLKIYFDIVSVSLVSSVYRQ